MKTALEYKTEHYPKRYKGRVPQIVRILKKVLPCIPCKTSENLVLEVGEIVNVTVNPNGAVSAIIGKETLGLYPDEFEVLHWHNETFKEKSLDENKNQPVKTIEEKNYLFMPRIFDTGIFSPNGDKHRFYLDCPVPECGGTPAIIAYGAFLTELRENVYKKTRQYKENLLGYPTHKEWEERVEEAFSNVHKRDYEIQDMDSIVVEKIVEVLKSLDIENKGWQSGLNITSHEIGTDEEFKHHIRILLMHEYHHIIFYFATPKYIKFHIISPNSKQFLYNYEITTEELETIRLNKLKFLL